MSAPTAYWQDRGAASPIRYPAANSQPCRYAGLHPRYQLLDPLVDRAERVLAQHGPLSLVVQLEVNPVDGEVAPLLLGPADELAAELGPRRLRRDRLGLEDVDVAGRSLHGRGARRGKPGRAGPRAGRTAAGRAGPGSARSAGTW